MPDWMSDTPEYFFRGWCQLDRHRAARHIDHDTGDPAGGIRSQIEDGK
jgi:hypothetical protein